ncbi:MAG TPA: hypothetical protein VK027_05525 [Chitinophagaceae bacterium]|nr:hypothetical protein [Chitinophagaceae bacterium]
MRNVLMIACLSIGLLQSCKNVEKENTVDIETVKHNPDIPVTLIDNEAFIADKIANTHVENIKVIVENAIENEEPNMENVAKEIEQELKEIYANTKMSDAPFNALDKYLRKIKAQLPDLERSSNKIILIEMHTYLSQYDKYFK